MFLSKSLFVTPLYISLDFIILLHKKDYSNLACVFILLHANLDQYLHKYSLVNYVNK